MVIILKTLVNIIYTSFSITGGYASDYYNTPCTQTTYGSNFYDLPVQSYKVFCSINGNEPNYIAVLTVEQNVNGNPSFETCQPIEF